MNAMTFQKGAAPRFPAVEVHKERDRDGFGLRSLFETRHLSDSPATAIPMRPPPSPARKALRRRADHHGGDVVDLHHPEAALGWSRWEGSGTRRRRRFLSSREQSLTTSFVASLALARDARLAALGPAKPRLPRAWETRRSSLKTHDSGAETAPSPQRAFSQPPSSPSRQ